MDQRPMDNGEINRYIKLVAAGNQDAFTALYTALRKPVYGLALSILRDRGLAEDVMQNTFFKLSQSASKFRLDLNGKAWIMRIARNEAYDCMRKRRDLPFAEPDDAGGGSYADNGGESAAQERWFGGEAIEKATDSLVLREAMKILSPDENQIVFLHLYCDLRHKDVAKLMSIPSGTAGRIYSEAIKKLKANISMSSL